MFQRVFLTVLFITLFICGYTQSVGINADGSLPHNSAILDVKSSTKGFLAPRMTSNERLAIVSPATGLLVYETTSNAFWVFNGTTWVQLGAGGNSPWAVSGTDINNSNSGNVGIGVVTPTSKLHIGGNVLVKDGNVTIDDPFGGVFFKTANINKGYMQLRGANYDLKMGTLAFNTTGKLVLETQNVPRITVEPGGNVGIGFNDPIAKLDVNGTIRADGNLLLSEGSVRILHQTQGKLWEMKYNTSPGGLFFTENAVSRLQMIDGGSFTFNGSNTILQLQSGGVDKGFVQLSGDNLRVGTNSSNSNGRFVVRVNGSDQFFVDGGGAAFVSGSINSGYNANIGGDANVTGNVKAASMNIGTLVAAPGYIVRIGGKMICEEVRVKLQSAGWPDYVFSSNHKLMNLAELRTFINENKHLPNIPSAQEVEKNGLEVGEMQRRMMEKIEELTLYILQLEEKTRKLASEMEAIQKQPGNKN